MGWFKVDDQLAFHSKTVMAGNAAMGLWVRAGAWASAQLTDGFIPTHMATAMANPEDAMALVMAGLWHEEDGGYRFHDWSDFQPDAAEEKKRREDIRKARSEAGKRGAEARWKGKKSDGKDGKTDDKPMTTQEQLDDTTMAPSRPVPSRPTKKKSGSDKPTAPKEVTPEHRAATAAYEETGKALNFMAVRGIAKWVIHDRGLTEEQAASVIVAAYRNGKPIIKSVIGQMIDGHAGGADARLQRGMQLIHNADARPNLPDTFSALDNDPFRLELEA